MRTRTFSTLLLPVALSLSFSNLNVSATAFYAVTATADINITSFLVDGAAAPKPTGLTLSGDAFLALDDTVTTSGGIATTLLDLEVHAADRFDLRTGDGIRQGFTTTGTASAPTDSAATTLFTDGRFEVANASPWDITIEFLLSYSLTVQARVDSPTTEIATAESAIEVHWDATGDPGDETEIIFENVAVNGNSETTAATRAGTLPFSITLPSGASGQLLVSFVDGAGYAEALNDPSDVPDAGNTAALLAAALLAAALFTRPCRGRSNSLHAL